MSDTRLASIRVGLQALSVNPLRTFLSTLGVIMGVGSMVSVLSMGDGVETFARDQIARTTDLLAVTVAPSSGRMLDGVFIPRTEVVELTAADAEALRAAVPQAVASYALVSGSATLQRDSASAPHGVAVSGGLASLGTMRAVSLAAGAFFTADDVAQSRDVVVLGARAAATIAGSAAFAPSLVGSTVLLQGHAFRVAGVATPRPGEPSEAFVPLDAARRAIASRGAERPVRLLVVAGRVEDVEPMQRTVEGWLTSRMGASWKELVEVSSNAARVRQSAQALLVFKLLMAAITGVSLLVGGIGIMNVLLAAVAERTREIGIRKAAGARNRDILVQFLAESVAITGAGSALGVVLGLAIAFLTAAIMRARTQAPVHAGITATTILFSAGAAIVVGIGFGLYPALRASRLSPIDAIRHE